MAVAGSWSIQQPNIARPVVKWCLYGLDQKLYGEIAAGETLHIGRTHNGSKVDLKIASNRVSRKQLLLHAHSSYINCTNEGINPVNHYSKKKPKATRMYLSATRMKKRDRFNWTHNEVVEFNIAKKIDEPIKFLLAKKGEKINFNIVFQASQAPSAGTSPTKAAVELATAAAKASDSTRNQTPPTLKRRRSLIITPTPQANRNFPTINHSLAPTTSTGWGQFGAGNENGAGADDEEDDDEDEEERISIVDRLGTEFSFSAVMNDLESNQSGSRVGREFQALLPAPQSVYAPTQNWKRLRVDHSNSSEVAGAATRSKAESEEGDHSILEEPSVQRLKLEEEYLDGLTLFKETDCMRSWTRREERLFAEFMNIYPKVFYLVARDLSNKLNYTITTKECIEYYYRKFKSTEPYADFKKKFEDTYSVTHDGIRVVRDDVDAGFLDDDKDPLYGEARGSRSSRSHASARERNGAGGAKSRKKGKRTYEMLKLIEAGLLKCGERVLYLNYHGRRVHAALNTSGLIEFEGETYESASAWSYYVKKNMNPKIRSDNGWSSVHYNGKQLSHYRDLYDPNMKTTLRRDKDKDGSKSSTKGASDGAGKETGLPRSKTKKSDLISCPARLELLLESLLAAETMLVKINAGSGCFPNVRLLFGPEKQQGAETDQAEKNAASKEDDIYIYGFISFNKAKEVTVCSLKDKTTENATSEKMDTFKKLVDWYLRMNPKSVLSTPTPIRQQNLVMLDAIEVLSADGGASDHEASGEVEKVEDGVEPGFTYKTLKELLPLWRPKSPDSIQSEKQTKQSVKTGHEEGTGLKGRKSQEEVPQAGDVTTRVTKAIKSDAAGDTSESASNAQLNGLKRKRSETWSKYDRYCICRKKYIETSLEDWYIQCSKGTSFCNGWVHPKCFDLPMTQEEGQTVQDFVCPLCSLDTIEYTYTKKVKTEKDPAILTSVQAPKANADEVVFLDAKTSTMFRSVFCVSDEEHKKLTQPLPEKSPEAEKVALRKRKVKYLPGTVIRSKFFLRQKPEPINGSLREEIPLGWFLGRVLGIAGEKGNGDSDVSFKYLAEYGIAPGRIEEIDLENSPDHMLDADWDRSPCFKQQDASWRSCCKEKQ